MTLLMTDGQLQDQEREVNSGGADHIRSIDDIVLFCETMSVDISYSIL